jgi:hypothetical protein
MHVAGLEHVTEPVWKQSSRADEEPARRGARSRGMTDSRGETSFAKTRRTYAELIFPRERGTRLNSPRPVETWPSASDHRARAKIQNTMEIIVVKNKMKSEKWSVNSIYFKRFLINLRKRCKFFYIR